MDRTRIGQFGRRGKVVEAAPAGRSLGRVAALTAGGIGLAAALLVAGFLLTRPGPPEVLAPVVAEDTPPAPLESGILVQGPGPAWVFVRELWQQTCPDVDCGGISRIYYGQKIDVYQLHEGWARISERYQAPCENGISPFVKVGNNRCSNLNGFSAEGLVAIWVPVDSLTAEQPADLGASVSEDAKFLASSDDIDLYERQFLAGAKEMMRQGLCTEKQLAEAGGFIRSGSNTSGTVYFTICGRERPHLDVFTGRVSRDD